MQQKTVWICTNLIFLIALGGCEAIQRKMDPPSETPSQVFKASFDDVWRSVHIAMVKYRLRVDNSETGVVETEQIKDESPYNPPFRTKIRGPGYRYTLQVKMVRGKIDGRPSVRVVVLKNLVRQQSFVDEPEAMASDGLEEKAILYRVERELQVDRGLQRAQKHLEGSHRRRQSEQMRESRDGAPSKRDAAAGVPSDAPAGGPSDVPANENPLEPSSPGEKK